MNKKAPTFSIIIPAHNTGDYIARAIESIICQTYSNYEIIVTNDGSTDNTREILKEYQKKIPMTVLSSEYRGVSAARNLAIQSAKGEYLVFLDSDDYMEKELLQKIKESIANKPDVVRFQVRTVTSDGIKQDYQEKSFENKTGEQAFEEIVQYHFVENIWAYAIKREYYQKNNFQFAEGRVHEDFGITPLIIFKAEKVNSISYIGYNYYRRNGSIMNNQDKNFIKKKVDDFYYHYCYLKKEMEKIDMNSKTFQSFIANSMILKICELEGEDYKKYKKILKKEKVYDDILTDTWARKMKKILFKIDPKLYNRKR